LPGSVTGKGHFRARLDQPFILLIQFVMTDQPAFTYIGGPTMVLEWGDVRFLTDPPLILLAASRPRAL